MIGFEVDFEKDFSKHSQITNDVLRALPEWFGLEDSIVEYCEESAKLQWLFCILMRSQLDFAP